MLSQQTSFIGKIKYFFHSYSFTDFLRKCIYVMNTRILVLHFLNSLKSWYYFKNWNILIGRNVRIHGMSFKLDLKKNITFYDNVIIEFGAGSELKIGNNCLFSYGVLLAINKKISIGDNVQVGEYTSIRDTTHRYDKLDLPIKIAGDVSNPIFIGHDVWIGRGCIVMPGSVIENGVVVGANSVVKGHLLANKIYAGVPLKLIKDR